MTYETWKEVIEREALQPGAHDPQGGSEMNSAGRSLFVHAGPTGCGNLPRPKERGGEVPFAEMVE